MKDARLDMHRRRMAARLSALHDGDLGRLRTLLLRRHLRGCSACQEVMAGLAQQIALLHRLGESESSEAPPPSCTFAAVQQALRQSGPERPARRSVWRLAMICAAPALAAGLFVLWPRIGRLLEAPPSDDMIIGMAEEEFRQAEVHYQHAIEQLLRVSVRTRKGWNPAQAQAYDEGLVQVGKLLDARRAAARARPADADAEEYLYRAYRSEIAFLQSSLRGGPERALSDLQHEEARP